MTINNFTEAQQAMAALDEFFKRIAAIVGHASNVSSGLPVAPVPTVFLQKVGDSGLSEMQTRVMAILSEAKNPMKQKDLVQAFTERGWPVSNPEKIGNILYSCATNLVRKQRLIKTKEGFSARGQLPLPGQ